MSRMSAVVDGGADFVPMRVNSPRPEPRAYGQKEGSCGIEGGWWCKSWIPREVYVECGHFGGPRSNHALTTVWTASNHVTTSGARRTTRWGGGGVSAVVEASSPPSMVDVGKPRMLTLLLTWSS